MRHMLVSRRAVVGGLLLAAVGGRAVPSWASSALGEATEVRGDVRRKRAKKDELLAVGSELFENDRVHTNVESYATLNLGADTRVLLGAETELLVDSFIAGQGGTLELGTGRMVFDRPEGLPKVDVAVRTAFGMIGVRGTKFFCGPSRAAFAVFVEHGSVTVARGGVTKIVAAGQGVEFHHRGDAPSEPVNWGEARIKEAYASVGLTR
ncbi:FecR family protein [Ensifer adhaerens]|uniref:FecR family protein n=1 Tax=Ensifer adhaerens TaxID=106592 RepID=UPI002E2D4698|nr:FecR family protein [Ensifer adhaerens]UAX94562.1 FecR family protein [Ensifer adhaerens]UAY02197.1 FecR family protein [Ensifer adhaerens]UAY09580.1 FecR family protein [Ensifer adhaerens]